MEKDDNLDDPICTRATESYNVVTLEIALRCLSWGIVIYGTVKLAEQVDSHGGLFDSLA